MSQEAVLEELKNTKIDNTVTVVTSNVGMGSGIAPLGRKKLLEDKIVSLVLKNPENLNLIEEIKNELGRDNISVVKVFDNPVIVLRAY